MIWLPKASKGRFQKTVVKALSDKLVYPEMSLPPFFEKGVALFGNPNPYITSGNPPRSYSKTSVTSINHLCDKPIG